MSAKYFLDTNVLIYALEGQPTTKASIAEKLIEEAISSQAGIISLQVAQEVSNAVTRKARIKLPIDLALLFLRDTLMPLCRVFPTLELLHRGLELQDRYRYSFYDSLIIAAALEAKCDVLYSEDLQDGQRIDNLTVINPFA